MQEKQNALLLFSDEYRDQLTEIEKMISDPATECRLQLISSQEFIKKPEFFVQQVQQVQQVQHLICLLHAEELKQVIDIALQHQFSIGLLRPPISRHAQIYDSFDIPRQLDEALSLAVKKPGDSYDILRCNGELVLGKLTLGQFPFYYQQDIIREKAGMLDRAQSFLMGLRQLFDLKPKIITIETAKEKTVTTAVTGVCIVENIEPPFFYFNKDEMSSTRDRQISVCLVAPSSIINYLKILLYDFVRIPKTSLQGIGYIKTEALSIIADEPFPYLVDGNSQSATRLDLHITHQALKINAGPIYTETNVQSGSDKERISVDRLPQNETRLKYLKNTLPFFSHALTEEFKELFITLRDNAGFNGSYLLLMLLSSMLATLGLFLNSASVVIGAMILAPLMAPIISLSMGLLRWEITLLRQSGITLLNGMLSALLISACFSALLPYDKMTDEILSRLHPSTLDLFVAIVSGIAGAYATAREHVAKSLPGVAIAVALVPPLCVTGIGIGWFDYDVFSSAFLLFLTNLIGITLAAMITFMLLGFAPFPIGARGVAFSTTMAAVISIPLLFSFQSMIESARIETLLTDKSYSLGQSEVSLKQIRIRQEKELVVSADLLTREMLNSENFDNLKAQIEKDLDKPVVLELDVHVVR